MRTKCFILAGFLIMALAVSGFGAITGSITGKVTDARTGEPLPGVSVSVQGSTMGQYTDETGKYTILNIPVGTYTVEYSSVGYAKVIVANIQVSADLATFNDVPMKKETRDLGRVIRVTAERPLVNKDKTTTVDIISGGDLKAMPVRGFEDVVALQNSVVRMNTNIDIRQRGQRESASALGGELNLRGGRPSEVAYYVDGFSQQDPLTGISTAKIADNAVQEIAVTSGAFSAEYGHVASGIVNIVTNSGTDQYHGNVEVVTDNLFGNSYDQNFYAGDFSGPLPFFEKAYFFFSGERRWLRDRTPSIRTEEIFEEYDEIFELEAVDPDHKNRLPSNSLSGWSYQGKLDFELTNDIKLAINGNGSLDNWQEYRHEYLFDYKHAPRYRDENLGLNMKITHVLSPNTFYNFSASTFKTERLRGDGVVFDDLAAYNRGFTNPEWETLKLFRATDSYYNNYMHRKSSYYQFKGDFNSQITTNQTLKLGFDFQRHTLRYFENLAATAITGYNVGSVNRYGFDSLGNESDNESYKNDTKHPINLGLYVTDRIEWNGMIINAGLRFDYFDYKALRLIDLENPLDPGNLTGVDTLDPGDLTDSKDFTRLSPRLGISFPISPRTQFHINYGKFFQRPDLVRLYVGYDFMARRITQGGSYYPFPSPNLEPEKITQYEAGITHQLGENTVIEIAAYYKDVQDLTQIFKQTPASPFEYDFFANTDYGTIKGFDVSLMMRRSRSLQLNFNYTLSWATGTGSYAQTHYIITWAATEPPKQTSPLDYDQRHNFSAIIDMQTFKGDGPRIGNYFPFEFLRANAIINMASGTPYTPTQPYDAVSQAAVSPIPRATMNSEYMPWAFQVDLRVERTFTVGDYKIMPFVWVKNLFNNENVYSVYEGSGLPDNTGYLATESGYSAYAGHAAELQAFDKYGLIQNNPKNFGEPRMILLGLRMAF